MKDVAELDAEIRRIWNNAVVDGISDLKTFNSAPRKILWILKEPNKERPKQTWDHREFHHKGVHLGYDRWKNTYQKIIKTSYAILAGWKDIKLIGFDPDSSYIEGENILSSVAIININKSGGTSSSLGQLIDGQYRAHRDFILNQIKVIDADIIINASRVDALYEDILPDPSQNLRKIKVKYKIDGKRILINTFHPNARIREELYCNSIIEVVNRWKSRTS